MDKVEGQNQSNIIKFPIPKHAKWTHHFSAMDLRKFTAAASLASVLFIVPMINGAFMGATQISPNGRGVASVNGIYNNPTEEPKLSPEVLRDLASKSFGATSSVGEEPTDLDQFQYGTLSGKYALNTIAGRISHIKANSETHLKRIEDLESFISSNKNIWTVQFANVIKQSEVKVGLKKSETYTLLDSKEKSVGKVTALSDVDGRLISLTLKAQ